MRIGIGLCACHLRYEYCLAALERAVALSPRCSALVATAFLRLIRARNLALGRTALKSQQVPCAEYAILNIFKIK